MQKIKLENVSFNKLKEFTSLGSKKNTTIKGKFTLLGEYQLITKDGGESVTNKQIAEMLKLIMIRLDKIEERLDKLEVRMDKLEDLVYRVIKLNNLKTK